MDLLRIGLFGALCAAIDSVMASLSGSAGAIALASFVCLIVALVRAEDF